MYSTFQLTKHLLYILPTRPFIPLQLTVEALQTPLSANFLPLLLLHPQLEITTHLKSQGPSYRGAEGRFPKRVNQMKTTS